MLRAEIFARHPGPERRLKVDVRLNGRAASTLLDDARRGLGRRKKSLPPKHFYDELGSRLFDRICKTEEYYQTRTELELLERVSPELISVTRPSHLVELGSGAAHKTQVLLDVVERRGTTCCYVPFDVSEEMLQRSSTRLLERYPWLSVHAIVGDYDHHLGAIPRGERRLFAFLGGTIGNFEPAPAVAFLRQLAEELSPADHLLLGTDLIKDESVLNAAYNDRRGVTADFNKNILRVVNRELGADFDLSRFRHVAFYNVDQCQIEMHLESLADQVVTVEALGMRVAFVRGERMLTEISRKFSRDSVRELLLEAGLELCGWFESPDHYFGLSLARRRS